MQPFFAYHFLQSLAFSLLNSLWQMALLWIFYNIILTFFSIKASTHFKLLVAIQATGFLWFLCTLIKSYYLHNTWNYESVFSISTPFIQERILPLTAIIYLFFVFVFITKFFIQFNNLKNIRQKELLPISNDWQEFINNAKINIDIAKNIQIKISRTIVTPLTIGFLKPIILIPVAAINGLTAKQLEVILLHELAHIKRNDYFINLLLMLVDAVMFFNPFSKYISRLIDKQRELSCDDAVLEYNYSNSLYAEALLNVAKSQMQANSLFGVMPAVNNNQQDLIHRIKRILNIETENNATYFFTKQMCFSCLFGILLFTLIGFININVKKVIAEGIPVAENSSFILRPIATNYHQENIAKKSTIKTSVTHNTIKKLTRNKQSEQIEYSLQVKRKTVEQGLQMIGKLATNNIFSETTTVVATPENDIVLNNSDFENNNTVITPAVDNRPTTAVQRFFVPATSKSAASIIVVSTTEKEDGKKIVKIEIEKGNSKVE